MVPVSLESMEVISCQPTISLGSGSVEIGPEEGVYLLDWHDQDVCGNAVKFPNSGRVYRIMPSDAKASERPNLRAASDAELVEYQMHSNDWYVRQARTLLHYRASQIN